MAVAITVGFIVDSDGPIDNRMVVADEQARLDIPVWNRYEGLIIYQRSDNIIYVCTDPGTEEIAATYAVLTTSDVSLFPFSGSADISGSLSVIGPSTVIAPTASIAPGTLDHLFLVRSTDSDDNKFVINLEGVTVLGAFNETPTAVEGGMFYSSSGEFYLGS
tara:strand:- start:12059 stop:12544 length:486 start_codon:yes stop_codon:yes gene_type:complete